MPHRTFKMQKRGSRLLAMLLLAVTPALSLATQDTTPVMVVHERPSGCHQHSSSTPIHQPVSYRCCEAGHNSAILQTPIVSQLDSAGLTSPVELSQALNTSASPPSLRNLAISSAGPPDIVPLRV
jgi:hypothetical protein